MAESLSLETQPRAERGSRAAHRLRKAGRVPAVLYGHKEATEAVTLSADALSKAIRQGARVVDLQINSGLQKALIRDIQWDYLGKEILHVDFTRVDIDERIMVTVPIEIRGHAPGTTAGGLLDQPMHMLSIECLATSIPESIRVNVNELQIGASIHVRDLTLPPGVQAMADPDAIVVHVTTPQAEPETPAVPGAAEQAEPEVITQRKAAEEEAE
jgi:large subunit ribosomal protein L25